MKRLVFLALIFTCNLVISQIKSQKMDYKKYTDEDWKKILTEDQFHILREEGTEYPGSSKYNDFWESGTYVCVACETPLYLSENKFDAHCGWPSFDAGIDKNIDLGVDYKIGYARTELRCKTCGGHLGHVFDDGPTKTGKRHCLNGLALKFIPNKK